MNSVELLDSQFVEAVGNVRPKLQMAGRARTNMRMDTTEPGMPVWLRVVSAVFTMVLSSGFATGVWIFGILMFTFSLDGVSSASQIPSWVEPAMLIGWPIVLGIAAIVPSMMFLMGLRFSTCLAAQITLAVASVVWFLVCWITTMSSTGMFN